jgi:hypothetical protein
MEINVSPNAKRDEWIILYPCNLSSIFRKKKITREKRPCGTYSVCFSERVHRYRATVVYVPLITGVSSHNTCWLSGPDHWTVTSINHGTDSTDGRGQVDHTSLSRSQCRLQSLQTIPQFIIFSKWHFCFKVWILNVPFLKFYFNQHCLMYI